MIEWKQFSFFLKGKFLLNFVNSSKYDIITKFTVTFLGKERCGKNMICKDAEGSYECLCLKGFENVNGDCVDINECESISL